MTRTLTTIIATAFLTALAIEVAPTPLWSQPAVRPAPVAGLIAASVNRAGKGDRLVGNATSGAAAAQIRLEGCDPLWSPLATPANIAGRCLS